MASDSGTRTLISQAQLQRGRGKVVYWTLLAMIQIVATMQLFIEPLILANGAGTQDSATSVAYLIYQHGFFQNDLNGAAALGVMLLVVLAGFSALYVRLSPKQD